MSEPISMTAVVHSEATNRALKDLAARLRNRRAANKAVAVQLFTWIMRNFDAEGALNHAWAHLSPAYAKRKARKYGSLHILEATGHLRHSFGDFEYDNDSATVGSSLRYSAYHELGLPERNLPRRAMLPTQAIALREAMDTYEVFVNRSVKGANLK